MAEAPAQSESQKNTQPAVNGSPKTGQEGEESQAPQLTLEAIQEVIEKATRPLWAEVTRVKEGKFPQKPKPQDPADRTLKDRLDAIEAKEVRMAAAAKKQSVRDAVRQQNLLPELEDLVVDHVLAQNGDEIVATGDDAFGWTDGGIFVDQPKAVADLVAKVVKAKLGDRARPPAAVPQGKGLRASGSRAAPVRPTSYQDVPREERLKMTPAERGRLFREAMESAGR